MNRIVSWQLMLFLCAISFRETLEKVAPMENPRSTGTKGSLGPGCEPLGVPRRLSWPRLTRPLPVALSLGQRLGPLAFQPHWEQSLRCADPATAAGSRRLGLCVPRSRLIPAPRGAALVQREKDLSAYRWNSFGLRYGRRRAAPRHGA
ncbi:metastasis-suppressor KiSS-1 [Pteropus vampyrus]|uniref:Metastasis-suppressor KiSS-1 n=1 Tax=Pteropus vampyrus TaxID=132908 RepID=A0A6P6D2Q5_PTEVA|nr:metastasis-suppressor KiSS-1 [Pteropus vampyrus]